MNKANLKPIFTEKEEPKGHVGWAINDPSFKKKKLKKPNFPAAIIENEPDKLLKKRIAEINARKKKEAEPKQSAFIGWLKKHFKP